MFESCLSGCVEAAAAVRVVSFVAPCSVQEKGKKSLI